MSSSTNNLGLTKLATGENFANSTLNANWEKVDGFAGECRNTNLGSFSTSGGLADILDAALAAMPSNGVKAFQINATSTVEHFGAATYLCTLYKSGTNTTYASATFRRVDSPIVIDGARNANGWSFNSLTSQIAYSTATPTRVTDSKWTSGTIALRKRAGIVQIKLDGAVLSAISSRETIATIPTGFVPATETYFFSSDGTRQFLIDTSGNLKAGQQSAGTVWGTGMYIIA